MKKYRTRLERERHLKKLAAEQEEVLQATGQESESKAKKWVQEVAEQETKKQKEVEAFQLEKLNSKKKNILSYKGHLMQFLHDLILQSELPKNWSWGVWFDGKGILLKLKEPNSVTHTRAFKPTFIPEYDTNACYEFALWAEQLPQKQNEKNILWLPKSTLKN